MHKNEVFHVYALNKILSCTKFTIYLNDKFKFIWMINLNLFEW